MTILGKVLGGPSPASIALKGTELILDADADTTITADTDDRIDIKIAGADDFKFTANNFNILSGSTLTVDSGATITNSGTANGFGVDAESAYAGVLQTNANFVDIVIFGPSVDGRAWNGLWNKASLFSSLMLATVEDEGSNSEINIWDLTEQSSGTISTTPLGTVDLANAATPTSIAACMGYIIVGTEDGIHIIDPHEGSWAERTSGWPRSLSASGGPALTNADVQGVAAGLSQQPAHDPRTNGPLPTFACSYGTGADAVSVIKNEGFIYDKAATIDNGKICLIYDYKVAFGGAAVDRIDFSQAPIDSIVADDFSVNDIGGTGGDNPALGFENSVSGSGATVAGGDGSGLSLLQNITLSSFHGGPPDNNLSAATAQVTRAVNSGYYPSKPKGVWLANSKTADLSTLGNTLTENGTVTESAVESGAELQAYSGFEDSTNYLSRAFDTDFQFGTGDFCLILWFKRTNTSGTQNVVNRASSGSGGSNILVQLFDGADTIRVLVGDGSNSVDLSGQPYIGSTWVQLVANWDGTNKTLKMYLNGHLQTSGTNGSVGSLDNGSAVWGVGSADNGANAFDGGQLTLFRVAGTQISADAVRQIYDAEKGMFVANAECLLQSGSTDAVLDTDVDPLTNKVLVTQTDAITIFKKGGLVVDSKPTVNSGNSEKGKLWGTLRAEQNSANVYVTAIAEDQRQVNEMVRGLASDLPEGVDLSKAKAWIVTSGHTTIKASLNVKSVTDTGTGDLTIAWAIPFKSDDSYCVISGTNDGYSVGVHAAATLTPHQVQIRTRDITSSGVPQTDTSLLFVAAFGELENE